MSASPSEARRYNFERCTFQRVRAHGGAREISFARVTEREDTPLRFIDLTVLPAGTDIGPHTHTQDNEEIYVILSGTGRMTLDEEEFDVGPGDVVLNRPGGTHGLRNTSDQEMRIVVVEVSSPLEPSP